MARPPKEVAVGSWLANSWMSCLRATGSMFCAKVVRDSASALVVVEWKVLGVDCMLGACAVCWDVRKLASG